MMPCMRPLVIIHGLFGSSKNWTTISRLISNDGERKVYALDLRNHNIQSVSPKLGEMKSWRILKDDLEEFWVETLKSNEFDLLGHSLGGQVAMSSVLLKDSKVRNFIKKLVVVDVSLRHPMSSNNSQEVKDDKLYKLMLKMIEIDEMKLTSRSEVIKEIKTIEQNEHVINFLLLNLVKDKRSDTFVFSNISLKNIKTGWPALKSNWNELKKNEFEPWQGETLFMRGESSDYIEDSDIPEIKKFFINSEIKTISNSGHWPHFDNKLEFLKILKEFLFKNK